MAGVESPASAAVAVRQKASMAAAAVAQRAEGVAVAPDESLGLVLVVLMMVVHTLGMILRLSMLMLELTQMWLPPLSVVVVVVEFVFSGCGRRRGWQPEWVRFGTGGEGDSGGLVEAQWRRQCRASAL